MMKYNEIKPLCENLTPPEQGSGPHHIPGALILPQLLRSKDVFRALVLIQLVSRAHCTYL